MVGGRQGDGLPGVQLHPAWRRLRGLCLPPVPVRPLTSLTAAQARAGHREVPMTFFSINRLRRIISLACAWLIHSPHVFLAMFEARRWRHDTLRRLNRRHRD